MKLSALDKAIADLKADTAAYTAANDRAIEALYRQRGREETGTQAPKVKRTRKKKAGLPAQEPGL